MNFSERRMTLGFEILYYTRGKALAASYAHPRPHVLAQA
jgi:hypothetical protein